MFRNTDYIDLINMTDYQITKWLRQCKWRTIRTTPFRGRELAETGKRRKLSDKEVRYALHEIREFEQLLRKWCRDEDFSEKDKWKVIHGYAYKVQQDINRHWEWHSNQLDDFHLIEIYPPEDCIWCLQFHLFHNLYEDVREMDSEKKPRICRGPNCNRLFRPRRIDSKTCSDKCRNRYNVDRYRKKRKRTKLEKYGA